MTDRLSALVTVSRNRAIKIDIYLPSLRIAVLLSVVVRFVHTYYSKTPHGIKGIGAAIRFKLLGEIIFPDIISMGKRL